MVTYTPQAKDETHAGWLKYPARWLREDRRWTVFAATPRGDDGPGWFVKTGTTSLSSRWDDAGSAIDAIDAVDPATPEQHGTARRQS